MGRRLHRLTSEVAKFLTVGGVATLVSLLIFNVLVHGFLWHSPGPLHQWPLTSYALANLVGMVVSYRGSRSWAFRHREVVGAAGGRVAFFLINTVTMAIPLMLLAASRYLLDLDNVVADNLAANVVGLALGTAARFWAFRRFVFVQPGDERVAPEREMAS
jgi:putative flippase GtrA